MLMLRGGSDRFGVDCGDRFGMSLPGALFSSVPGGGGPVEQLVA
jgi:hypothetical protein